VADLTISGREDAIVAAGIVRLHGFAEIERSAGQGIGQERSPNRVGQVGTGLHHDDLSTGPIDVETKLMVLQAKVRAACLDLRRPQRDRQTGIGGEGAPARGAPQIKGRRIGVTVKHYLAHAGSITLEIDAGQIGTIIECNVLKAVDAA